MSSWSDRASGTNTGCTASCTTPCALGPATSPKVSGSFGNKEFARYARIAKASELEVLNHLIDLRDQRLISEDELMLSEHATRKALKAVVGLIRHLESTPDPPRPPKRDEPL